MDLPATRQSPAGLTVEGASADLLRELLARYDFELVKRARPIADAFLPGLSDGEISDRLGNVGLSAPDELLVWWGWHNGLRLGVPTGLRQPQMSLTLALGLRDDDDLGLADYQWDPQFIRVAGEGSKRAIAVSCSAAPPPVVLSAAPEFGGTNAGGAHRRVVSLCTPVTWWLTALLEGWSTFDADDLWEIDDAAFPDAWRRTAMTQ